MFVLREGGYHEFPVVVPRWRRLPGSAYALGPMSDALPDVKKTKIASIKADGLGRIQALFPAIASFDDLALEAERWQSLRATAKQATVTYQRMIDIYTAGLGGVAAANAASTQAQVLAVTVAWP